MSARSPSQARTAWLLGSVIAAVAAAAGCGDPAAIRAGDIRSYRAPRQAEPAARRPRSGATAPTVAYDPPAGWSDRGASGMRLATLVVADPLGEQEVTISRAAGSPEANVSRWWGQLEPTASPEETAARTAATLAAAERVAVGDGEALVVSLEPAAAEDDAEVILGGIVPLDGSAAVFVKFKGPAAAAKRAREDFVRLVSSIRWN